VEVEAAGGLQHPVNLDDPQRHMHQIGQQAAVAEHLFQPLDQCDRLRGQLAAVKLGEIGDPRQPVLRLIAPFPGIDKGLRLRPVLAALVVVNLEVVALGIERRINVAKINAGIGNLAPQHVQVIAVIQPVLWPNLV
jgi:hypothetical protein